MESLQKPCCQYTVQTLHPAGKLAPAQRASMPSKMGCVAHGSRPPSISLRGQIYAMPQCITWQALEQLRSKSYLLRMSSCAYIHLVAPWACDAHAMPNALLIFLSTRSSKVFANEAPTSLSVPRTEMIPSRSSLDKENLGSVSGTSNEKPSCARALPPPCGKCGGAEYSKG